MWIFIYLHKKAEISAIQFFGDYFGTKDTSELETFLLGTVFKYEELSETLAKVDVSQYILNFSNQDLLNLLVD